MRIDHLLKGIEIDEVASNGVLELLHECDDDFLPCLSSRRSTRQSDLSMNDVTDDNNDTDGVLAYFTEMGHQPTFVAYDDDGSVTGFLTYVPRS